MPRWILTGDSRPGLGTNPFVSPRTLAHIPRHFSLSLPQRQSGGDDRNSLSISKINEKLSRISEQRNTESASIAPSARSSNINLLQPVLTNNLNTNAKRKTFISSAYSMSNVNTGGEGTGNEGEESVGGPRPPAMLRPRLVSGRSTSSTLIPRISSWGDSLSARYMFGARPSSSSLALDNLDQLRSRSENELEDREGGVSESAGPATMDSEGEAGFSDSIINSKHTFRRPSVRSHKSDFGTMSTAQRQTGYDSSKERREREKRRFHSMLNFVDRNGSFFLEEPLGSAEGYGFTQEPDNLEGLYPYDWEEDDIPLGQVDIDDQEWVTKGRRRRSAGKKWSDPLRRRSFESLDDYWDMPVLTPERMKVDVEVCGQVLVMLRREEHLRNVVTCLEVSLQDSLVHTFTADHGYQVLNGSLSSVNSLLRQEYESHLASLSQLTSRTKVLADLDLQGARTDNLSQQTNVLRYEAEQFNVPALYHTASLSRQKTIEMRHKVFGVHKIFDPSAPTDSGSGKGKKSAKKGTGSRRVLPEGVKGAHGKFNRLQKRLDGTEVVVDWLGRTESEAEEEERLARSGVAGASRHRGPYPFGLKQMDSEDEQHLLTHGISPDEGNQEEVQGLAKDGDGEGENVVEHSSIRPMWLLRFFMGWGQRWSATTPTAVPGASTSEQPAKIQEEQQEEVEEIERVPTITVEGDRDVDSGEEDEEADAESESEYDR